jgi:Na+-transporting methylmalonyl-CoA/oxaloacetate decarboxylase beta subunit
MYGKSTKMTSPKTTKKDTKKSVPIAIMVAVGKPKAMPMRGQRTATNMMKKSGRGK